MSAHEAHAKGLRLSTPCSAHSITFGGKCLNCGWDPELAGSKLFASLRSGDTVTLTVASGQFVGEARFMHGSGEWLACHENRSAPITIHNLIGVSRRLA